MTLEEYMRELVLMSRQYGQEEELYPLINMLLRENDNVRHLSVRDVHQSQSSGIRHDMLYGYASFPDMAILDERYQCSIEESISKEKAEKRLDLIYGCIEAKNYLNSIYTFQEGHQHFNLKFQYRIRGKKNKKWIEIGELEDEIKKDFNNKCQVPNKKIERSIDAFLNNTEVKHQDLKQLFYELIWYGKVIYTNGKTWMYLELKNPSRKDIIDIFSKNINESMKICISISSIKIGDLTSIYETVEEKMKTEQRISTSVVGQYITYEDRQEWERLKDNLARINWCGTNTLNQFRLKTEN